MNAVHGRYLQIDVSTGVSTIYPIPDEVHRDFLGGIGLGTWLLFEWCPAGTDALSPAAPLIFASSPFIGTGLTTASKLAVLARSPQTGFIGDSLTSSYLAITLKRAGVDALVITGARQEWSTLVVDNDQISIQGAEALMSRSPDEVSQDLRARLGNGFRVASIGVAGENLVRYAAISNDGRLAGRTGLGAVMGSKRLKAIAVRGTGRLPAVADSEGLAKAAKTLSRRSLGPETAKYRELGTAANLAFFNRMSFLPSRNFQTSQMDGLDALHGEALHATHRTDKNACAACTIGCEHHYALRNADGDTGKTVRLEYESLYALGPLCGVNDPDIVLQASRRCDDLALDTISTGATIAWAMECRQNGIMLGDGEDEIPEFGDGPGVLRLIELIAHRTGIGDLLAEGSRRAAEITEQGSDQWALHVKGLELPGYDPRKLPTLALGLAVATRGACHNRSSAYEVDLSDSLPPDVAIDARAGAAIRAEDQASLLDSLNLCKFLRHCFDDLPEEGARLFALASGHSLTGDELLTAGERINTLKKLFNIRHGWTPDEDWLPPRVLANDEADSMLSPTWLRSAINAYYTARNWSPDGYPTDAHLRKLGLNSLNEPVTTRP
ncbi:MAG: aldehyde ferredoxin oxidoreductase family protein [Thermomicrobiaceae bacterium]